MVNKKNVLLLYRDSWMHVNAVREHVFGFCRFSSHKVTTMDVVKARWSGMDFTRFDCIVIHFSASIGTKQVSTPQRVLRKIATFNGPKILFLQDEHRWVDDTAEAVKLLGINVLFSVANEDVIRKIYHHPWFDNVRLEHTLTGFVDRTLCERDVPPFSTRPIDVSYRARKESVCLGKLGWEKHQIGKRFKEDAAAFGLAVDISNREEDRVYGEGWISLVSNSKAVLGVESGSSVCDFNDSLRLNIEQYTRDHPEASYAVLHDKFLKKLEGSIAIHVVSPRYFEAAALRTLMILYPGTYSNILKPWRHYVPLERDHSNMDKIVAVLRDADRANEIIDNAFHEIAMSDSYTQREFIRAFDKVVGEEVVAATPRNVSWGQIRLWKARGAVVATLVRVGIMGAQKANALLSRHDNSLGGLIGIMKQRILLFLQG